jgi:polyphenol oxidase
VVIGVRDVDLGPGVGAWFTGRDVAEIVDANLAHHVPHRLERLRAARDAVGIATGTDPASWHLMRQVHGADVAVIAEDTVAGAESRDVDVLVTDVPGRPLVVLAADCLPMIAVGRAAVGVAHAGWRGLVADVPGALVAALTQLGESTADLRVAIGPAIGPCCYEVGPEVVEALAGEAGGGAVPAATTWGSPSVDLRAVAHARLRALGVTAVFDAGGTVPGEAVCTACTPGWWSHRIDPEAGRHAGLVVRLTVGSPGACPIASERAG